MHRFIFHSNKVSFIIEIVILCYFLIGCGTQGHTEPTLLSKEGYLVSISDYATEEDTRWAKYLYDHLKKRAEDEDMIAFGVSEKDMFRIIVQIDPALKNYDLYMTLAVLLPSNTKAFIHRPDYIPTIQE